MRFTVLLTVFVLAVYFAAVAVLGIAARANGNDVRARIPQRCLSAEDSAAHVYLYRYGDGVAQYHCRHKGY